MRTLSLGKNGPPVSRVGLGCMGMSGMYGPADRAEGVATIHAAMEAGVVMLDTGDFYGMGHNEMLIGEALRDGRRDKAFIAVKFGAQRDPGGAWLGYDARPAAVKTALAYTLQRLGVDHVDLYQPARVDPNVPIEETVGAIADCVKAGWVRHIGLSEVSAATLRKAHAEHPIRAVQIEYSLASRGIEQSLLPTTRELGVSITAYGVLSRGLLSNPTKTGGAGDFRAHPLQRREPGRQPAAGRGLRRPGDGEGSDAGATGLRLGAGPGRGRHPADRRPPARAAGRIPGRPGRRPRRRRPRPHRGGAAGRRHPRRPLPGRADGAAGGLRSEMTSTRCRHQHRRRNELLQPFTKTGSSAADSWLNRSETDQTNLQHSDNE